LSKKLIQKQNHLLTEERLVKYGVEELDAAAIAEATKTYDF